MHDTVTEHDVETDGLWTEEDILEAEEYEQAQKEYWDEVRECCGGTDFWCGHYRKYPPLLEVVEP